MSQTSSRPSSAGTAPVCTNGSGRDTPASVDSIPLEWDHDYDLDPIGHSMSAQRGRQKEEDEELLCLATAALTGECVWPEGCSWDNAPAECSPPWAGLLCKLLVCFVVYLFFHRRSDSWEPRSLYKINWKHIEVVLW